MSPPLTELSLDHPYTLPAPSDGFEQCYDPYSTLIVPAGPGPVADFASENLYLWHDVDGSYHNWDAPATRYSPSYYPSDAIPLSDYFGYRHDLQDLSRPAAAQDGLYISHLAQQVRNGDSGRPHLQDHRSSIARASDNFLAQGSSIFSDGHSSSRRGSIVDYRLSVPHQSTPLRDTRPPSRKRSRESLDDGSYLVKGDDNAHPASLPTANDACRLPQPHMMVPLHPLPSSVRIPRLGDAVTLPAESHTHERDSRLRHEERCAIPLPKYTSNKRVHRSSEDLVRQENGILSIPTTTTWPIPDDQAIKGTKKPGEQKKQALACLFCRERKIACGRPPAHNPDQTCNQCARRRIKCEYPTESRRGQHKRRRKPTENESASQATSRTNVTSNVASTVTAPSSTIVTTTSTPPA